MIQAYNDGDVAGSLKDAPHSRAPRGGASRAPSASIAAATMGSLVDARPLLQALGLNVVDIHVFRPHSAS